MATSSSGETIARSTTAKDDQHHRQDQGHDQVAVVAGGPLDVEVDRAAPADLGVGAGDRVDPGAKLVDGAIAGLAVGGGGQGPLEVGVAVLTTGG